MQKVLFPTDFSPAAEHAFVYALHLTQKIGGAITTLHAYEPPDIRGVAMPNLLDEIYESVKTEEFEDYQKSVEQLRKIAEAHHLEALPMDHVMQKGPSIRVILNTAKKEKSGLIVMGTKGASGLKEVFLGSIAGEIMEKANCPVLAIPEEAVFDHNIDRIAMATEFKPEDEKALQEVLKFANLFNAQVTCLHVCIENLDECNKKIAVWREMFADHPNLHFKLIRDHTVTKALNKYIEEEKLM
ncbi:MAG: universal stress protein [Saprospiraceae bacterium]|nr:universal stress protein [Saprospiraceae bacterium]